MDIDTIGANELFNRNCDLELSGPAKIKPLNSFVAKVESTQLSSNIRMFGFEIHNDLTNGVFQFALAVYAFSTCCNNSWRTLELELQLAGDACFCFMPILCCGRVLQVKGCITCTLSSNEGRGLKV